MSLRYASSIEDSEVRALLMPSLVAGPDSVPILRTSRISGRFAITHSSGVSVFPGPSTLELLLEEGVLVVSHGGSEMLWKTPAASSVTQSQLIRPNRHKSGSSPSDQVSAVAPTIWTSCGLLRSVAELVITVLLWPCRSVLMVGLWYEATIPAATRLVRLSKKFIPDVAKIGTAIAVILKICLMSAVLTAIEML